MKTSRCLAIFALFCGFAVFQLHFALAADGIQESAKYSKSAANKAKSRQQVIRAEIQKLPEHAWAGNYYAGDGLGVNTTLVIAPESGYVFEWHGCVGLYDRNYGTVIETNGLISLTFTFENKRKGFAGIAPKFIPVSWGARHYLIPADDVIGFCNNINNGREPRDEMHGFYFLREGDENKNVTGQPKLPKEFQAYLLSKPIEAKIIAVGPYTTRPSIVEWKFKDTPVTLDAGSKKGLRVGMELLITKPKDIVESVRITKVELTRSEAVMTQAGEEEPGPKTGWRVSTQAPWNTKRSK